MTTRFSPDASLEIDAVMASIASKSKFTLTLEDVLNRWERLAGAAEAGYSASIYDYANDLAARDVIQDAMSKVSDSARRQISSIVEPIDARFYDATRPITKAVVGTRDAAERPWWFRVPRKMGADFAADVLAEGIT